MKITKEEYSILGQQPVSHSRIMMYVLFGILVFVVVFFPIYGLTLRYQIGYILKRVFDTIGYFSLLGGGLLLILSFVGLIVGKSIKVHYFLLAIVLLWIGGWCTGQVIELFGIAINESTTSQGTPGYH